MAILCLVFTEPKNSMSPHLSTQAQSITNNSVEQMDIGNKSPPSLTYPIIVSKGRNMKLSNRGKLYPKRPKQMPICVQRELFNKNKTPSTYKYLLIDMSLDPLISFPTSLLSAPLNASFNRDICSSPSLYRSPY